MATPRISLKITREGVHGSQTIPQHIPINFPKPEYVLPNFLGITSEEFDDVILISARRQISDESMSKAFRKSSSMLINLSTDTESIIVDILKVIKIKYDYRTLSKITGFPVSTLTRYVTGKTAPRGAKAERLLRNILSNINLPAFIAEYSGFNGGRLDLTRIMLNPNLVKIIGAYVLEEFAGMKITSIMPLDILSLPLASYLSITTSRPLYLVSPSPISSPDHLTPLVFSDEDRDDARAYWLLLEKNCNKESVLLLSSKTPEPRFFNSLIEFLMNEKIEVGGFFVVAAKENILSDLRVPPGIKRSYLFMI